MISCAMALDSPKAGFPEPIVLGGQALVLNGTATRSVFGIRVYDVGLYVSHTTGDGAEVMERNSGSKRLKIIMLRSVPEAKFVSAVQDHLDDNLTPAEQVHYARELASFFQSFEKGSALEDESEVTIDYLPLEGTVVMIDGRRRAVIPGGDFYHVLLRLWIGKPLQSSIRTGLLGKGRPR